MRRRRRRRRRRRKQNRVSAMWSLVCSVQLKITEWKKFWNTKIKWFDLNTTTPIRRHSSKVCMYVCTNWNYHHRHHHIYDFVLCIISIYRRNLIHSYTYCGGCGGVVVCMCCEMNDVLIDVCRNYRWYFVQKGLFYFHCRLTVCVCAVAGFFSVSCTWPMNFSTFGVCTTRSPFLSLALI